MKADKIKEESMDSELESGVEIIEIGETSYGEILFNENGEIEEINDNLIADVTGILFDIKDEIAKKTALADAVGDLKDKLKRFKA